MLAAQPTLMARGILSEEREEAVAGSGVVSRARMLAHHLFAQTHRHLGIELDPCQEFPVVAFAWPVTTFHTDEAGLPSLTPDEEEVAYANYLRRQRDALQAEADRTLLLPHAKAVLLEELVALVPAKGGALSLASPEFVSDTPPCAALRERWERMPMAVRAAFLREDERATVRAGDQLLAIDGKRVPRGVWDAAAGRFDHTETYHMLEQSAGGTTTTFTRADERKRVKIQGHRVRVSPKGGGLAGRWREVVWDEALLDEATVIVGEIIAVEEHPHGMVTIATPKRTLNLPNPRLVLRTDEPDDDDGGARSLVGERLGGGQGLGAISREHFARELRVLWQTTHVAHPTLPAACRSAEAVLDRVPLVTPRTAAQLRLPTQRAPTSHDALPAVRAGGAGDSDDDEEDAKEEAAMERLHADEQRQNEWRGLVYDFDLSATRHPLERVPLDLAPLSRAAIAAATDDFHAALSDVLEPERVAAAQQPWWEQRRQLRRAGTDAVASAAGGGTARSLEHVPAAARRQLERLGTRVLRTTEGVDASQRERACRRLVLYLQCLPRSSELVLAAMANRLVGEELHPERQLDEATLWVRRAGSCESAMLRLHKGRQPRTLVRELSTFFLRGVVKEKPRVLKPKIRSYVRTLTDLYDLRVPYWESVECVRKVVLVGGAVFLGPGSLRQVGIMLVVSMAFTAFYVVTTIGGSNHSLGPAPPHARVLARPRALAPSHPHPLPRPSPPLVVCSSDVAAVLPPSHRLPTRATGEAAIRPGVCGAACAVLPDHLLVDAALVPHGYGQRVSRRRLARTHPDGLAPCRAHSHRRCRLGRADPSRSVERARPQATQAAAAPSAAAAANGRRRTAPSRRACRPPVASKWRQRGGAAATLAARGARAGRGSVAHDAQGDGACNRPVRRRCDARERPRARACAPLHPRLPARAPHLPEGRA